MDFLICDSRRHVYLPPTTDLAGKELTCRQDMTGEMLAGDGYCRPQRSGRCMTKACSWWRSRRGGTRTVPWAGVCWPSWTPRTDADVAGLPGALLHDGYHSGAGASWPPLSPPCGRSQPISEMVRPPGSTPRATSTSGCRIRRSGRDRGAGGVLQRHGGLSAADGAPAAGVYRQHLPRAEDPHDHHRRLHRRYSGRHHPAGEGAAVPADHLRREPAPEPSGAADAGRVPAPEPWTA